MAVSVSVLLSAQAKSDAEKRGDFYFGQCVKFFNLNSDSSIYYSGKAMTSYKMAEVWEKYMDGRNAHCTAYYASGDYAAYQECAVAAVEEAGKYMGESSNGLSNALSNYSVFLQEKGDHHKSIQYLKRALEIETRLENKEGKIVTLNNLGVNYFLKGDYNEALKYYFEAIAMGSEEGGVLSKINKANIYSKIGDTFFAQEKLDSAVVYFGKCLRVLSDPEIILGNLGLSAKINARLYIAEIFLKRNQPDSVRFHTKGAIDLAKDSHAHHRDRAYEILGNLHFQQKKFKQALAFFLKAKNLTVEKFSAYDKHYSVAEKDILLARAYEESGSLKEALNFYHRALQMLSRDLEGNDVYQVPGLDSIYSSLNFLTALTGKANTFFKVYLQQKSERDLRAAYENFEAATKLIRKIRQDYEQKGSRLQLSTRALPVFEGAIETALELNKLTGDVSYLHRAFFFCESSKSILLLESMNESLAKGFAGIPDSLLEKENDLRLEISFFKRKLNQEKNKGRSGKKKLLANINKHLFDLDQSYKALIDDFENNYPKYHKLKYDTRIISVDSIQQKLKNTSCALIAYFFGEKNIYTFSITPDTFFVNRQIKEEHLLSAIRDMREFLSNGVTNSDENKEYEAFVQNASKLFQKLLAPSIPSDAGHLILVADDRLGYLPFEVLLTGVPVSDRPLYSLKNLSYLIEAYEISYSYSATLFFYESFKDRKASDEIFLGIAPAFDTPGISSQRLCNGKNLYSLKCSEKEVEAINALLGGKTLVKQKATKSVFESKAPSSRILHLATHACLDDEHPGFSKIYLTDDYITNNELYNLQLNANLTVLSACDTGSGKLAKGEGVLSLARGFIHAGCPSVVMSLWSVDDCATSEIMVRFYEYLYEGQTKSQAIRQAKLDYISNAKKAQQHPYYWAGFVQVGDFEPVLFSTPSRPYLKYLLVFILLSILAYSIFANRSSRKL